MEADYFPSANLYCLTYVVVALIYSGLEIYYVMWASAKWLVVLIT